MRIHATVIGGNANIINKKYCHRYMNMIEFKKTISVILNPATVFVSRGTKAVVAIPKEEKTDNETSIRN